MPSPGAAAAMSAQLRPEGASPLRVANAKTSRDRPESGDVAFDRWLKRELGRLYDSALDEPIPDELTQLIERAVEEKKQRKS
jgi:hypothetical protein